MSKAHVNKVYVVNLPTKINDTTGMLEPSIDVADADEFGEIVYILPMGELIGTPAQIVDRIHKALDKFVATDHLLLCGDPRAIAWASAIAADKVDGNLSILRWIRNQKRYQPVRVALWESENA